MGAERLGACQSGPGNLPDCFAREVRGDGHGNGVPCLGLRAAGAAGASATLALCLHLLRGKAVASFRAAAGPFQAAWVARGTRDGIHASSLGSALGVEGRDK